LHLTTTAAAAAAPPPSPISIIGSTTTTRVVVKCQFGSQHDFGYTLTHSTGMRPFMRKDENSSNTRCHSNTNVRGWITMDQVLPYNKVMVRLVVVDVVVILVVVLHGVDIIAIGIP
jgi:hypothetical protein